MTAPTPPAKIAIVLPPREMFSPTATGAVGLLVRLLAQSACGTDPIVYGMTTEDPFQNIAFQPIALPFLPCRQATRYAIGLARAVRRRTPDLIEVHNRPDIALHLARRFPAIPVVLFLHNDPQGMRQAKTPTQRQNLIRTLAAVAPVSNYLRTRLLDGLAPPTNVRLFPNFVDLKAMPAPAPEPRILFAGRVVADKGADSFVAACAQALPHLPGWRAEMVGADRFGANSPETPFLRDLRPKAQAAGVAMLGWRPHAEVLDLMATSAIVVVPSRWPEPFGLTALEAMACGSALLCAPRGGLVEVMGDAAVPIDPDNAAGMAETIVVLARNNAHRQAVAQAGLIRAADFGADQAAVRLAALRRSVLRAWRERGQRPI